MGDVSKVFWSFLLILLCFAPCHGQTKRLVIKDVNVINVSNGKVRKKVSVVISNGRIASIEKNHQAISGDTIIEGRGKFLIPGLADMHLHLRNEESVCFPLLVANGVTTVRDMHNRFRYATIGRWRDSINNGNFIAPRIAGAAGRIINGYGDRRELGFARVVDEADGRKAVQDMKSYGADFIKVYNDLPASVYLAITAEAKKQSMPIAGHLPFGVSLDTILQSGHKSIEHLDDLPFYFSTEENSIGKRLAQLATDTTGQVYKQMVRKAYSTFDVSKAGKQVTLLKQYNAWLCPTLWLTACMSQRDFVNSEIGQILKVVPSGILKKWLPATLPAFGSGDSTFYSLHYNRAVEIFGMLHKAGVNMIAGTDSSPNWEYIIPGYGLHFELELYVKAGMTPYEALRTATLNPALFLNQGHDTGSVDVGKVADLVLLNANPLVDIRNTRDISSVILKGRFLNRAKLDGLIREVDRKIMN